MPRMTTEQWMAYSRRLKPFKEQPSATPPTSERDLHDEILAECRRRGLIAFHGSMAHRTFRTLGEPDFIILADSGRFLLVECKTKHGKLSPEQLGLQAMCKQKGHTIHVVRSLDEFLSLLP